MTAIEEVEAAIKAYDGVSWSASGFSEQGGGNDGDSGPGWVKFGLEKSEMGWRALEFLSWVFGDMVKAGEQLVFVPTAPPPYLNEPGSCLSFVVECYPLDGDQEVRFRKVAEFINWCRSKHWAECRGNKH